MEREKYDSLPQVEKEKCDVHSYIRFYRVFNIDQTNMKDVKPELYEKLTKGKQQQEIVPDTNGMYANAALDRMFERQEWVCPIHIERTDHAFYRPSTDEIHVPEKVQYARHRDNKEELYNDGMDYYASTLHEMAHSTGAASRLNRQGGGRFGDPQYAKEELVAELTSALVCTHQGMSSRVSDESAKYLNSWIGTLKQNPDFIMTVLTDVNKAARMINDKIGEQQKLLEGEKNGQAQETATAQKGAVVETPMPPIKWDVYLKSEYGGWYSDMSGKGVDKAKDVYWFEDASEASAYCELHRSDKALQDGVLFVTGHKTKDLEHIEEMMRTVLGETAAAKHHICFSREGDGFKLTKELTSEINRAVLDKVQATDDRQDYLASISHSGNYMEGDPDLLPTKTYKLMGEYHDALDELRQMKSSGIATHPDDIAKQEKTVQDCYKAYRDGVRDFLGIERKEDISFKIEKPSEKSWTQQVLNHPETISEATKQSSEKANTTVLNNGDTLNYASVRQYSRFGEYGLVSTINGVSQSMKKLTREECSLWQNKRIGIKELVERKLPPAMRTTEQSSKRSRTMAM